MKRRLLSLATLTALLGVLVIAPAGVAAATPSGPAASAVTGIPITGSAPGGYNFTGTFDLTRFAVQNGQLVAVGELSGTLTRTVDGVTTVIGTVTDLVIRLPVTASGTCQILHLELGPLDLDLLGLQIHLDKVVLDITAQSGPGNLLGNLLCGIAGLLDSNAVPSALARILNQLLAILG